jgi:hypothetical protein
MYAAPQGGVGDTGRTVGLFGGETGYDFVFGIVTLRPTIGLGAYVLRTQFEFGTSSNGAFYLEPSPLMEVTIGHLVFGVDANVLALPELEGPAKRIGRNVAFTTHLQVGFWL